MCRNIKTLFNFDPPATELEIRDASLQFVRKLSGFNLPSPPNRPCQSLGSAVKVTLDDLPNLGPRSRAMLASAGITTLQHLRKLGAVAAYARVKRSGANASLNLLWALEGALTGLPWQVVAREHRTSLLLALEQHERGGAYPSIPPDVRRPHP